MCSGTDSPLLGYKAHPQSLGYKGYQQFDYAHKLACDKSRLAQRFIKLMHQGSVRHLYKEMADMVKHGKPVTDLLSASGQSIVEPVDDLIAGFPCQDVSLLNPNRASNANVIEHATKR